MPQSNIWVPPGRGPDADVLSENNQSRMFSQLTLSSLSGKKETFGEQHASFSAPPPPPQQASQTSQFPPPSAEVWPSMYRSGQNSASSSFSTYSQDYPQFDPLKSRGSGSFGWQNRGLEKDSFFNGMSTLRPLNDRLDFTGPNVSILERFSGLGDAARRAEIGEQPMENSARQWPLNDFSAPASRGSSTNSSLMQPMSVGSSVGSGIAPTSQVAMPQIPVPTIPQIPASQPLLQPSSTPATIPMPMMPANNISGFPFPTQTPLQMAVNKSSQNQNSSGNGDKKSKRKKEASAFLESVRCLPPCTLKLEDFLGNVYEASIDQYGSRFIQERLSTAPLGVKQKLLIETLDHALDMSSDVFGNYVIQLLFEVSDPYHRGLLFAKLKTSVSFLTFHMYGCRVIQMAVKFLGDEFRKQIVGELSGQILECIQDHNGNHVIQKIVENAPSECLTETFDVLTSSALSLSKHMYGCRVIQRALEHGTPEVKQQIFKVIKDNLEPLVLDKYGNYVVQHVVDFGPPEERDFVLDHLIPRIVKLSSHKFASNVIEKCFVKCSADRQSQIVDLIVNSRENGQPVIIAMMRDQYANYVIQRMLSSTKDGEYARFASCVKQNLPLVKRGHSSHGKHLQAIEKRLR